MIISDSSLSGTQIISDSFLSGTQKGHLDFLLQNWFNWDLKQLNRFAFENGKFLQMKFEVELPTIHFETFEFTRERFVYFDYN